jgi:hypothetical protein
VLNDDEYVESPAKPSEPAAQSETVNCFLISKIAGGVGLNLQAADTVFLLDVDYNPQRDFQALSRVYRVGQTRPVKVFRLVADHDVERRMRVIAEGKEKLEEAAIRSGRFDLVSSEWEREQQLRAVFDSVRGAETRSSAAPQPPTPPMGLSAAVDEAAIEQSMNEQLLKALPRDAAEREVLLRLAKGHWADALAPLQYDPDAD